jgi:hypothetical protein
MPADHELVDLLVTIRDQTQTFEGASLLPSVRRDAGLLHEAILKRDEALVRRLWHKHKDALTRDPREPVRPAQLARIVLAQAAFATLAQPDGAPGVPRELAGLPADLTTLSEPQLAQLVAYYDALPLSELAKRRQANRSALYAAWHNKDKAAYESHRVRDRLVLDAIEAKKRGTRAPPRDEPRLSAVSVGALVIVAAGVAAVAIRQRR